VQCRADEWKPSRCTSFECCANSQQFGEHSSQLTLATSHCPVGGGRRACAVDIERQTRSLFTGAMFGTALQGPSVLRNLWAAILWPSRRVFESETMRPPSRLGEGAHNVLAAEDSHPLGQVMCSVMLQWRLTLLVSAIRQESDNNNNNSGLLLGESCTGRRQRPLLTSLEMPNILRRCSEVVAAVLIMVTQRCHSPKWHSSHEQLILGSVGCTRRADPHWSGGPAVVSGQHRDESTAAHRCRRLSVALYLWKHLIPLRDA